MLKYVGGTFSPLAAAARVSFIDHMESEMPDNWSQTLSQSFDALPGCPCLRRAMSARFAQSQQCYCLLWLTSCTCPGKYHLQLRRTRHICFLRLSRDELHDPVETPQSFIPHHTIPRRCTTASSSGCSLVGGGPRG